ncbi:hypothetical protein LBMAG46_13980 [Planctomycetia bacterium]|nr:hypothetical protein LBMAG46_13980 [Planctomycetia bacterium]
MCRQIRCFALAAKWASGRVSTVPGTLANVPASLPPEIASAAPPMAAAAVRRVQVAESELPDRDISSARTGIREGNGGIT